MHAQKARSTVNVRVAQPADDSLSAQRSRTQTAMFITVNNGLNPKPIEVDNGVAYNVKLAAGGRKPFRMQTGETLEHFEAFVQRKASEPRKQVWRSAGHRARPRLSVALACTPSACATPPLTCRWHQNERMMPPRCHLAALHAASVRVQQMGRRAPSSWQLRMASSMRLWPRRRARRREHHQRSAMIWATRWTSNQRIGCCRQPSCRRRRRPPKRTSRWTT